MCVLNYEKLSKEITEKIENDINNKSLPRMEFDDNDVIRRNPDKDKASIIRTPFIRDIDKNYALPVL